MRFFHGTDKNSADKIIRDNVLKGDRGVFGPGVCVSVERALNYSAIKCFKYGLKAFEKGRILIIELPDNVLLNSTRDSLEAFTLDDSNGKALVSISVSKIEILTIRQAQKLISIKLKEKYD